MDLFKTELSKQCDVKGLKCPCCNPSKDRRRTKTRRRMKLVMKKQARAKLKEKLLKEFPD